MTGVVSLPDTDLSCTVEGVGVPVGRSTLVAEDLLDLSVYFCWTDCDTALSRLFPNQYLFNHCIQHLDAGSLRVLDWRS